MAKKKKQPFSSFGAQFLLALSVLLLVFISIKNLGGANVLGDSTENNQIQETQQTQDSTQTQDKTQEQDRQQVQEQKPEHPQEQQNLQEDHNFTNLHDAVFETENNRRMMLGKSSLELSTDEGHMKIAVKDENGVETKLNNDSLDEINKQLQSEDIEISSESGGFGLRHGDFKARTNLPISINPITNELTVTTPAGSKIVAVLPDKAVANLLSKGLITTVASSSAGTGISLEEYASQSAYVINGVSDQKLLGLFPVGVDKTAYVSAENGQVLAVNQSLLSKILDLISF